MLEAALAAGVAAARRPRAARRRAADARRGAAGAPLRLRPGRRRVGLAQPLPGQRDQVLRPRRHEARRRPGGARSSALLGEPRRRPAPGRVRELHGAAGRLPARARGPLRGPRPRRRRRSCSTARNGATYRVAPEIFRRLGADVDAIAVEPDGRNINDGCGSTHVERSGRAHASRAATTSGFAFDGDGDRVLAVDRNGDGRGRRRADRARRAAPARARPAARRRRGRDGDDQLRLPPGHARAPGSRWRPRRSATATCWPSCCSRGWALGRRAVRPHHRHRLRARRATASPRRC